MWFIYPYSPRLLHWQKSSKLYQMIVGPNKTPGHQHPHYWCMLNLSIAVQIRCNALHCCLPSVLKYAPNLSWYCYCCCLGFFFIVAWWHLVSWWHWFRWWHGAWPHQAITWANANPCTVRTSRKEILVNIYRIESWTRWPPFCRWHGYCTPIKNFTEVFSWWSNW